LEVKSRPVGRRDSSRYLYWAELEQALASGYSALVYQHFRREKRDAFIERMAQEMRQRTGAARVYSFRTARVVFFLMPSDRRAATFERNVACLPDTWGDQIRVQRFEGD